MIFKTSIFFKSSAQQPTKNYNFYNESFAEKKKKGDDILRF